MRRKAFQKALTTIITALIISPHISAQNNGLPAYEIALENAQRLIVNKNTPRLTAVILADTPRLHFETESDTLKVLAVKWVDSASYRKYYNNGKPGFIKSN